MGYGVARASALDAALTLSTLIVMLLPGAPLLLGLLAAVHVVTVLQHLPSVYNHWYFAGFVSLALVLACASAWWQSRRNGAPPEQEAVRIAFAPAARWCLLLLYFVSGFHKLNADFFDPGISCASELYGSLSGRLGGPPNTAAMGSLVIGVTVVVELGLPVLLLVPRFRRIGVGVGILFHLAMALAGYPRFSAAGIALLSLFLPLGRLNFVPALRVAFVAALLAGSVLAPTGRDAIFLWAAVALGAAILAVTVAKPWPAPVRGAPGTRRPTAIAMLGPALVLVSGVFPYLGLGTDRAFSMYSNLRTEDGRSNHFIVPAALQVFAFQRDLVQVLRSSRPGLERLGADGLVIPFSELRARLTEEVSRTDSIIPLTYLRGATSYEVPSVMRDSILDLPVSSLRRKFLRFRPIEAAGPRRCGV